MLQCLNNVDFGIQEVDQGRCLDAAQFDDLDCNRFI